MALLKNIIRLTTGSIRLINGIIRWLNVIIRLINNIIRRTNYQYINQSIIKWFVAHGSCLMVHFYKSRKFGSPLFNTFRKDVRRNLRKIPQTNLGNLGYEINIYQKTWNGNLVIWDPWLFETLKFWNQETLNPRNQKPKTKKPISFQSRESQ